MADQFPRLVEAGVWLMYAMGALLALGCLAALVVLAFIISHFWKMRKKAKAEDYSREDRWLAYRDAKQTRRFKP